MIKSRPQANPVSRSAPVPSKGPAGGSPVKADPKKTGKTMLPFNRVVYHLLFCAEPKSRVPLIIVPQAATSVINGFNAKDLLEDFK